MKEYKLKPKQVPGYTKLVTQLRHLLLYRMGTGKTVVWVKAMYDCQCRRVLILCPKNAITVHENHIREWFQGLDDDAGKDTWFAIHRYRGKYNNTDKRRAALQLYDPTCQVNVYIMTYAAFVQDHMFIKFKPDCIVLDEAKRIRNRKSQAFKALVPLARDVKYIWPGTGTPGQIPWHFWTMFHLIDPKYFSSFWKFANAFHYTQKNPFGGTEILGIKNKDEWYRLLDSKTSQLTKKDMGHQETVRQVLHIEMDDDQRRLYAEIDEHMIAFSGENLIVAQTSMTKVLRLRQLLCCPKILDPNLSIGAAFADYVETIENDTDPHTVVFTPFTASMPHFKQYFNEHGFDNVFFLHGGVGADELDDIIAEWKRTRGQLICSILYATAFSLEPASECFFPGYEWDPDDNEQAEERLNRLTTDYQVNSYYYAYEGTYTKQHLEILDAKYRNATETKGLLRPTQI